jgi:hypothetical protein
MRLLGQMPAPVEAKPVRKAHGQTLLQRVQWRAWKAIPTQRLERLHGWTQGAAVAAAVRALGATPRGLAARRLIARPAGAQVV